MTTAKDEKDKMAYIKLSLFPCVEDMHNFSGETDDKLFDELHVLF